MRVLMVSDVYFPRINGVSTAIQTYQRTLAHHGIDVSLIAPDYGHLCTESWISRVPGRAVPGDPEDRLVHWKALCAAVDEAVEFGCDLVHIQTPFLAHYAGLRAARRFAAPVIATYHTLFEEYFKHYVPFLPGSLLRGLARGFSRRQCNALDSVIVPSRAIHARLTQYGVTTPMHILPTGIPVRQPVALDARAQFRLRHGIPASRPLALFVGRVAHEKNIDYLFDVLAQARQTIPDLLLLVAGEGPALPSLRKSVIDKGLQANVQFIGYLDRHTELPACYAAADAFVFASRTETQGLVLLEAMAAGLPVVALAEMGTIDILGPRRGAVVPEDHPAVFAESLCSVLSDPALHQRLSHEGRNYAAEWSDESMALRMATLYRHIIANHSHADAFKFSLLPL